MNIKNKIASAVQLGCFCIGLGISGIGFAKDIIVEGVVPNEQSKQAILAKTRSVYPQDQVIDKIQVRPVSAPNGWSESVTNVITPDLKKVSQGKLSVRGTQVNLKKANTKIPISTSSRTSSVSRDDTAMKPMPETIACTRSTAPKGARSSPRHSGARRNPGGLPPPPPAQGSSAIRFSRSSTRFIQRSR